MRDALGNRYTGIVAVAVGDSHLLALTNTGHVLAWGENSVGQLADGTLRQRAYPVFVRNSQRVMIANITSVAARGTISAAVTADGRVLGWGSAVVVAPISNTSPSILARPAEPYARPLADGDGKAITGIRHIALGASHTLGLTLDGRVKGWGSNSNGQLGDGTNASVTGTATVILGNGQQLGNIIEIAVVSHFAATALSSPGARAKTGNSAMGRILTVIMRLMSGAGEMGRFRCLNKSSFKSQVFRAPLTKLEETIGFCY